MSNLKIKNYESKLSKVDFIAIKKILFSSIYNSNLELNKQPKNLNSLNFKISIEIENDIKGGAPYQVFKSEV